MVYQATISRPSPLASPLTLAISSLPQASGPWYHSASCVLACRYECMISLLIMLVRMHVLRIMICFIVCYVRSLALTGYNKSRDRHLNPLL